MLNPKQRKVSYELTGNTIVSASPGTGKTRTLISRAQCKLDSIPKHKSLALITYTNAGADEISSRLISDNKNIFIGTIHRFCLEFILRPFGWIYKWDKPRVITYDELNEFIEINADLDLGDSPLEELNKIKRQLNGKLDLSVEWGNVDSLEYVAELFYGFLKLKKAIDFNEILYRSFKIISENDFVTSSLANKFYEISIDEFQDTNIFQYEILKAINKKKVCTFFMVGDEKQKIYRFAGAIEDAFQNASVDFEAKIENLDTTYRSTSNIIAAYSSLYKNHPNLKNESIYKEKDYPLIFQQTDNDTNNNFIERNIESLINKSNIKISEIAVLTNSWRDAFFISRHLRQKFHVVGLGALPHRSVSSSAFSLLRSISKYYFSTTIRNLRVIRRNIEFHALENNLVLSEYELTSAANSLISEIQAIEPSILLLDGLTQLRNLFDTIFKIEHSSFDEIVSLIKPEEASNWTLQKYFKTLSGVDGITINTIHQAKGLEYEVVILNGVNEGAIPYQFWDRESRIRHPLTQESLIDGTAKLYVGVSRAKALLLILHNWRPSMFIPILKSTNK
jgi:superfamily I DNA/RNA helicase